MPAGPRRDGGATKPSVTGRGVSLTASLRVSSVGRRETWRCQADLSDVPRANRAASIPPRQKLQEVYRQFTDALQNACGFAKNETVLTPRMRPSSTRDDAVTLTLAPMLWSPLENTRAERFPRLVVPDPVRQCASGPLGIPGSLPPHPGVFLPNFLRVFLFQCGVRICESVR
jgi:hypothetical protein